MAPKTNLSRREFVKNAGGLLIGFSLSDSSIVPRLIAAASAGNRCLSFPDPAGRVGCESEKTE